MNRMVYSIVVCQVFCLDTFITRREWEILPLSIDKLRFVLLSDFYSNLLTEKTARIPQSLLRGGLVVGRDFGAVRRFAAGGS